jgi:hypothetical protein
MPDPTASHARSEAPVIVYVVVTHDNCFVNVYASQAVAEHTARAYGPGYGVEECEVLDA